MSLTDDDLSQVRDIVVSAIQELVLPRFDDHDKRLATLESDVHEIKEDVSMLKADIRGVKGSLSRLEGRVEALEADIKELYAMVAARTPAYADKSFAKLSVEQKVLQMYRDVKVLAQEAGITLPN